MIAWKLELVQSFSFYCKVAWRSPNFCDGWYCKGNECKKNSAKMADMDHLSICSSFCKLWISWIWIEMCYVLPRFWLVTFFSVIGSLAKSSILTENTFILFSAKHLKTFTLCHKIIPSVRGWCCAQIQNPFAHDRREQVFYGDFHQVNWLL